MSRQRENEEFVIEVRGKCGWMFRVPVAKEVHSTYFENIHANENRRRKDFRYSVISYNMICRNDDGLGVEGRRLRADGPRVVSRNRAAPTARRPAVRNNVGHVVRVIGQPRGCRELRLLGFVFRQPSKALASLKPGGHLLSPGGNHSQDGLIPLLRNLRSAFRIPLALATLCYSLRESMISDITLSGTLPSK